MCWWTSYERGARASSRRASLIVTWPSGLRARCADARRRHACDTLEPPYITALHLSNSYSLQKLDPKKL